MANSTSPSTLSTRGAASVAAGGHFEKFKSIWGNPYHPDTNTSGFVNIGTSDNFLMHPEAADFANENFHLDPPDMTYGTGPWGSPRLRNAMVKHLNRHFHPFKPFDAEHLLFASGITAISEMLGFTICDEGDAVLFSRPCYQAFVADFGTKAKVTCEYVSFGDIDQFSAEAVAEYEKALLAAQERGVKIRALLLCHPHNPLGRCYTRDALIAFMKLCQKYKIHLLADEIYALSVYDVPNDPKATKFQSIFSLDTDQYINPNYLHLLYGMSKDTAAGGLRMGCFYSRNEDLFLAMSNVTQFHWIGVAGDRVAALMLEDEKWIDGFQQLSRERLAAGNKMTRKLLDDEGIKYYLGANAGFFLWLDLRPYLPSKHWAGEKALTQRFLDNKVFVTDGHAMSAEEPGWFRLIFSQDERVVREGVRRIMEVLKGQELTSQTSKCSIAGE